MNPRRKHKVEFVSFNEPPTQQPDPAFPSGLIADLASPVGASQRCSVDLPYPAECRGVWRVECETCGLNIALTAAGRTDDPRQVVLPCYFKQLQVSGGFERRPYEEDAGG